MHLSKKLKNTKNDTEKSALIDRILETSTVTWGHFLIHGEYDFSDKRLIDTMNFKFSDLLNPQLVKLKRDKEEEQ